MKKKQYYHPEAHLDRKSRQLCHWKRGYSLLHVYTTPANFFVFRAYTVAHSRILLQKTNDISIWILQLHALTCDTKKCILSGDFLLSMIFPLNGPKHFPFGICVWAKSPALRNSGGRCASSFCIWEGLPVMIIETSTLNLAWKICFQLIIIC